MYKITPSIYMSDTTRIKDEITALLRAGIDHIHLDIMDGHFVNNYALGPKLIDDIKRHFPKLIIDAHIMANNLIDKIDLFHNADYITFHWNSIQPSGHANLISKIKAMNCKVGIGLDLNNNIQQLQEIIKNVDLITVMSIKSGFSGQNFDSKAWSTIRQVKAFCKQQNLSIKLQIDGGVRWNNIKKLIDLDVDYIVVGSLMFSSNNYSQVMKKIKEL